MDYPIEYVAWVDSTNEHGWQDIESLEEEGFICETVGFLVKETETSVMISSTAVEGGCLGVTVIPKVSIVDRYEIDVTE